LIRVDQVICLGDSVGDLADKLPALEAAVTKARRRTGLFEPPVAELMTQFKKKEPLWKILISNKKHMSGYDAAPSSYEGSYLTLLQRPRSDRHEDRSDADPTEYELSLKSAVGKRAVFTTRNGFCGTCVPDTEAGDVVTVIFGSPSCFILRASQDNELDGGNGLAIYHLVGGAYVGGIMNGEMVDELYCEDLMDSTTFFIQ
jgi:hypothetical protein